MNSRDSSPIYVASAVRVFVLLFSFSKMQVKALKNTAENQQKIEQKSLIYGIIGTQERVLVKQGK